MSHDVMPEFEPEVEPAPEASRDLAVRRLEDLISQYVHVIRASIRSVFGRQASEHLEDIEQEVLLELWKQLLKDRSIEHPSSYLYRAAARETIRLARRMRKRQEESIETFEAPEPGPAGNPERLATSAQTSREIRRVVQELVPRRRKAVIAHLAGYSMQEVMKSYGWTYNQTRNLISRGIADLRRILRQVDL